ncbi:type IV toxin-antitoxin system AbiEi family antitoxin domain-containing protein [Naasia aerilata]|uniref:AbiEi antitoxin N-terminal domain-containing protein n=1 Tax=Naasia aerilata TaxID=1162966 RepID=A0ABN6XHL8_9MICO|nr:type IV toxin-antitoxin system AbiEi family antitoxin domain-containing protein [Naasia aerilata]BDZ44300.1 hypothetical protein GCM10025866_02090 [Naasia aerilata]
MDRLVATTPLLLSRDLRARTGDSRSLSRAAEQGRLVRVRRGVYVDRAVWEEAGREERALLHLRAYEATADALPVFSHQSAALLHGLPLLALQPDEVHVVGGSDSGGRRADGVRRHPPAVSRPAVLLDGMWVTDRERTIADLAASLSFPAAVVVADAGLRAGASIRDLRDLADSGTYRAWRKVQRVVGFATGRSESAGESLSRALMDELGLPAPELQREFFDRRGFIGRVDFWWPEQRIIGEFDGRVKYGAQLEGSPEDRLWFEKRREDRLRALGPGMIRWVWDDLRSPAGFRELLVAGGLTANRNTPDYPHRSPVAVSPK